MDTRSLWFEPRLQSDRAARRARDLARQLGEGVHDEILAAGDRIAAVSPLLAQQFYKAASAVWQIMGRDGFRSWLDLGLGLASRPQMPREAALAYFAVRPATAGKLGLDGLERWCGAGSALASDSRKLAATFFTTTAPLLDRLSHETLDAWMDEGRALQKVAGWRGEFLAQAYFASAPATLTVLEKSDFGPWARLGARLQPVLREQQYFGALPEGFGNLKAEERLLLLATATAAAELDPGAAVTILQKLAGGVRRTIGPARGKILRILRNAAPAAPVAVAEVAPVVGALVRDLPAAFRSAALDLAVAVSEKFPRGSVALLRSLPIACEDARPEAVTAWIERGLQLAGENAEAGEAYFALESRTSISVLHASSTAVALGEVQGLLRKFVQMLSGRPAAIRSSEALMIRPPLEELPQENEIELPLRVDVFPTHEDNVRVYRFLAAQLAGRREFGTYDPIREDPAGIHAWLYHPDRPRLLADWFLVTDGVRVAAALARAYGGLAREQRALCALLLQRLCGSPGRVRPSLFDLVYLWLVSGGPIEDLPEDLRIIGGIVSACAIPLTSPGATVEDALRVAELLTRELEERTRDDAATGAGGVLSDQMTGDALIAAYLYDDDDSPMPQGEGTVEQERPAPDEPLEHPLDQKMQLDDTEEDSTPGTPLSAEALKQLLEAGIEMNLKQGKGTDVEGLGLFITDLLGKLPSDQIEELRNLLDDSVRGDRPPPRRWLERQSQGTAFYYDEWDYHITDYRRRWCRLLEGPVAGDSGEFFQSTLSDYAAMIPEVRRQFQKIRPDTYRVVRGLEDGEDFDLNAVVDAHVDRRARRAPSPKLYVARQREERDVATLFLIDMSASTDEPMEPGPARMPGEAPTDLRPGPGRKARRIIDVTKEALVIMSEALEEIGDAYAIYGFSGHGRSNVEFYLVKSFQESLNAAVKGRIGGIEPRRSTRMGTALRHAMEKMAGVTARSRHLILLSDGFPQDFDYGQDRRSNVYGLRDTTVALRECEAAGITPFCITVDKAGHDYLREMCHESRYMVIDDIGSLPRELPKIYQRVVTT